MWSPTKIQKLEREMKSIFDKTSDEVNLMANKMEEKLIKNLKSLRYLKIILKETHKVKIMRRLKIKQVK